MSLNTSSAESKQGIDLNHLASLTAVMAKDELVTEFLDLHRICFDSITIGAEVMESLFWRYYYKHPSVKPWSPHLWVLVAREDAVAQKEPLTWIISIPKIYLRRTTQDEIKQELVWNLYSTITHPRYRGRGYCTRLVQLLHYILGDPANLPPFPSVWGEAPPLCLPRADRPATLPFGIASRIETPVIRDLLERATIGEAKGTGFRFSPQYGRLLSINPEILLDNPSPETPAWTTSWLPRHALPVIEQAADLAARRALAAGLFGHGGVMIPYPGHPGAIDFKANNLRPFILSPEYPPETLMALSFRSTAATADHESASEFFCVFFPNLIPGTLSVAYFSPDLPTDAIPLLLARLRSVAIDNECHSIEFRGMDSERPATKAILAAGGTLKEEPPATIGFAWYGPQAERESVAWEHLEHWSA